MAEELFLGEHYILELSNCCPDALNDPLKIQKSFLECADLVNATVICTKFHHFEPYGVSGVVVISESHMTIHTWPEFKYAAVDVFTCSSKMESSKCLEFLAEQFGSSNYTSKFIPRGFVKNLTVDEKQMNDYREYFLNFRDRGRWGQKKQIEYVENEWIYEEGQYSRLGLPYDQILYDKKSEFQDIKIVNSPSMGKTLIIDHVFMICEKTQENYHEMMVHPVMQILLHKGKSNINALIIGGGDGGAARELLRYPEINKIVVAELDGDVISSCREHIPKTAHAFDHEKVTIQLGDGLAYVEATKDKYDLILCDGCDPVGEAANLFAEKFYENCHNILNDEGMFLTQGESPIAYNQQFKKTHNHLKKKFGEINTGFLFYHQPLYEFGYWAFQVAIKSESAISLKRFSQMNLSEEKIEEFAQTQNLKYYNYDIHLGAMAVPNYVKKMLKEDRLS